MLRGIIGFFLGLVYGMIMNVWSWLILEPPLTATKFFFILSGSFIFDLAHGVINFVFLYFFGHETINILLRYQNRFLKEIIVEPFDKIGEDERFKG